MMVPWVQLESVLKNSEIPLEQLNQALSRMILIRDFEERVEEVFVSGKVRGTAHTCIGQEAIPVALGQCYQKGGLHGGGDLITSTHRGHGHFLGVGADPNRVMAELFGREGGYSRGRGGSQLMADYQMGFIGANGIVAGSASPATGMALAFKQRSEARVAICYLGDGSLAQGSLFEAMNMAGLWHLPVLFVVEYNNYAMSTPASAALATENLATMAQLHDLNYSEVDGNDYIKLHHTFFQTLASVRQGTPALMRCNTYRQSGHSRGDKRVYRTREEESQWKDRDPIDMLIAAIIDRGGLNKEIEEIRKSSADAVEKAITFSEQSPFPDPAGMNRGVFA